GFQSGCLGMRAQEMARTIGKKIANSTVGKSTCRLHSVRGWAMLENHRSMTGGAARAGIAVALALTIVLGATWTPTASAGCGGVETAAPKRKVAPRPPLAIGDSSMLLALPALARVGYRVNARGCRQFSEGLRVMRQARRHHRLPRLVVLAL